MTNTNRANIIKLYQASIAASTKAKRNADKLAFMSMTKNNMFAFETYGDQLAAYQAEAKQTADAFAAAASGLPTAEIVSLITEATQSDGFASRQG
jgi:hypothetical protein